jgi:hypothetical protein
MTERSREKKPLSIIEFLILSLAGPSLAIRILLAGVEIGRSIERDAGARKNVERARDLIEVPYVGPNVRKSGERAA